MRTSCPAFCSPSAKRTLVGGDSSRLKGPRAKGRPPEVAAARGRLRRCRSSTMRRHRLRRVALQPAPRRSHRRLTPFFSSLLERLHSFEMREIALWGAVVELLGLAAAPLLRAAFQNRRDAALLCRPVGLALVAWAAWALTLLPGVPFGG